MHSSRMRTGRSLTICQGGLLLGGCQRGDVPGGVPEGMCQTARGECVSEGGAMWGVPGGCHVGCARGCVRGGSDPGGCSIPACTEADPTP